VADREPSSAGPRPSGDEGISYTDLERVEAPPRADFLRDYVRPRRPVVLTGMVDAWRARHHWSLEYLAETFGDTPAIAAPLRNGTLRDDPKHGVEFLHVRLREFIESLGKPGSAAAYVMAPTWDFPARLQQDYETPPYCTGAPYLQAKVWVGKEGTVTPAHRDIPHNFHVHLGGRKRWLLFSPRESSHMYRRGLFSGLPNFAWADPEQPDFERFPRLRGARGYRCVCGPGDTLFIPSGWWHHTRLLDDAVSMNFWWGGRLVYAASRVSATFKRVRNIQRGEWA